MNLEKEAKEALLNKDAKRLKKIFSRYWDYCRELPCTPQEAKEGCIRIVLVVVYANCDMYSPVYMGS